MKRRHVAIAVVIIIIMALVLARSRRHPATTEAAPTTGSAARAPLAATLAKPRPDPRTMTRASIAGTVSDEAKAPIAHARVCVEASSPDLPGELTREPRCAASDDQGHFAFDNLYPATYTATAMAKPYRPGNFHPSDDRHELEFRIAAGEHKTGVDIVLEPGGVELSGRVADVNGGPIAHAQVRALEGGWDTRKATAVVDTDDQGQFSLWLAPGDVELVANADGYAPGEVSSHAPGKIEVLLTPESSLAGTVVDTKGQPVEGAAVAVQGDDWSSWNASNTDLSDAQGHFRVSRLGPGRYSAVGRTDHGYGRTEGSMLVGLGQHVDGVVIRMLPAHRIAGKLMIAATGKPCPNGDGSFVDQAHQRWISVQHEADGTLYADGVIAGSYTPELSCRGYQSKDHYDVITIADKDATGLVWEVDAGATIRGKVVTKSGDPVEGAEIWASTTGGAARAKTGWGGDASGRDGSYELGGLKAGGYKINVRTDRGLAPKDGYQLDVPAGGVVQHDLVLDDGGTIHGTIVDAEGHAVASVQVRAKGGDRWSGNATSDEDGAFTIEAVRAGDYRVSAARGWSDDLRKPGTTDDAKQGERVTVRVGQTAVVRLVVESQSGTITGSVADADGKPVSDAFVSAARESDAAGALASNVRATRWTWDDRPVLTATDGTFTVTKLSPGTYTVRAYRKGGGEAVTEHVAVGGTAALKIQPTGSIDGTVTRPGGVPDELTVMVINPQVGFSRSETFYATAGHFTVRDLPAGHFTVRAEADSGQKSIEIDLADGEAKTGLAIELESMVTLTGRVVDLVTKAPVPGMRMMATLAAGGSFQFSTSDGGEEITDDSGAFTIKTAPRGSLSIRGFPKDWSGGDYPGLHAVRTVDANAPSTVDLGDLPAIKRRVKTGDPVGELGINYADRPPGTPPDQQSYKVSFIDPAGPAARTDLKVGDVIVSVDGVDVSGANSGNFWTLVRAPPGTKLALGLQRGITVSIVLAAP